MFCWENQGRTGDVYESIGFLVRRARNVMILQCFGVVLFLSCFVLLGQSGAKDGYIVEHGMCVETGERCYVFTKIWSCVIFILFCVVGTIRCQRGMHLKATEYCDGLLAIL